MNIKFVIVHSSQARFLQRRFKMIDLISNDDIFQYMI